MHEDNESAAFAEKPKSAMKPAKADKAGAAELMTPEEHARALGQTQKRQRFMALKGQKHRHEVFTSFHNAASVMHGWASHAHHTGEPIKLTREAYLAAIEAAHNENNPPAPAALSPYKPGFVPPAKVVK